MSPVLLLLHRLDSPANSNIFFSFSVLIPGNPERKTWITICPKFQFFLCFSEICDNILFTPVIASVTFVVKIMV